MFVVYTSSPQSFWHQRLLSWMTTFQRTDVGGSGGRELRTQAGEVGDGAGGRAQGLNLSVQFTSPVDPGEGWWKAGQTQEVDIRRV